MPSRETSDGCRLARLRGNQGIMRPRGTDNRQQPTTLGSKTTEGPQVAIQLSFAAYCWRTWLPSVPQVCQERSMDGRSRPGADSRFFNTRQPCLEQSSLTDGSRVAAAGITSRRSGWRSTANATSASRAVTTSLAA